MERPTLDKFPASVLAQIDIQAAFIVSRNDRQDPWHSRAFSQAFSVLPRFPRTAAGYEQEVPKHAFYREILH